MPQIWSHARKASWDISTIESAGAIVFRIDMIENTQDSSNLVPLDWREHISRKHAAFARDGKCKKCGQTKIKDSQVENDIKIGKQRVGPIGKNLLDFFSDPFPKIYFQLLPPPEDLRPPG